MTENASRIVDMPLVTRMCPERGSVITETAEQLVCPECKSAFELDLDGIDCSNDFDVDCPDCEQNLEIHPRLLISSKPISYTPAEDLFDFLEHFENKTAVLNAAVRQFMNSME